MSECSDPSLVEGTEVWSKLLPDWDVVVGLSLVVYRRRKVSQIRDTVSE